METPLSLRIKFKMETGEYPVWETVSETFRGNPKTIYGQWLEEQLGNKHDLRWNYKSETALNPVSKIETRPYWGRWRFHNNLLLRNVRYDWTREKFTIGYSLWLEELMIKETSNLVFEK